MGSAFLARAAFLGVMVAGAGMSWAGVIYSNSLSEGQPKNFEPLSGEPTWTKEGLELGVTPKSGPVQVVGFGAGVAGVGEKMPRQFSVSTTINIMGTDEKPVFDFSVMLGRLKEGTGLSTGFSISPEGGLVVTATDTSFEGKEVASIVLPYELIFKPIELETTIYDSNVQVVTLNGETLLKRLISDAVSRSDGAYSDVGFLASGESGSVRFSNLSVSTPDDRTDPAPAMVVPEAGRSMGVMAVGVLGLIRRRKA